MNTTQSHDILAKLLATENVTVIRENVSTASFDIKNRVLRLPRWKKLTSEVEEMLILHEVGHALYTTPEVYGQFYEDGRRYLKEYANVIEDVRIEKKMKDRYPGSRKTFNIGYTELNDKDFFGVKGKNLSDALLIDRINIFYKVGYNASVPFNAEEYVFVQKADKCVTEEDVIDLAEEIFAYSKQQKQEEQKQEEVPSDGEGEYENSNGDGSNDFIDGDDFDDESIAPKTMDNFESKLSEMEDRESRTYYFNPEFEYKTDSPIVGYKKILEELPPHPDSNLAASHKKAATDFKSSSTNIVNYLVKEFEMRKSASAYKRTKISRLGQLDTRKLFAYKLKDDIFKQIATVQEGKKHGMIFLLDWSGSMSNYIHETVQQVINLAMFCRKINIPFQVFAFTDGYEHDRLRAKGNSNGVGDMSKFTLLEFFNHKMNTREFNQMIEVLLTNLWSQNRQYCLQGTPLNDSLLFMIDYVGKFIHENQVEKMTFITLTDGESNRLSFNNISNRQIHSIKNGSAYITENGTQVKVNAKCVMQDKVTHKEYALSDIPSEQTSMLLNMIRDRYQIHSVGFYIVDCALDNVQRFVKNNMPQLTSYAQIRSNSLQLQSDLRREKSVIIKNIPGRDELYLLASSNKIVDDDIDDVTEDMNAAQISKKLTRMFTSRKGSRVVLSSFIGMAA
jgi:hypothetical protein